MVKEKTRKWEDFEKVNMSAKSLDGKYPRKKTYTKKKRCYLCLKPVQEYDESNKTKTVKAWVCVCISCFRKI